MTETTAQPNPQVVAWMRGHLREHPDHDYIDATNAYFIAHPYDMTKDPPGMRASYETARKPLTVADIPAGQGIASLYVDGESGAVMYRTTGGRSVPVPAMWVPIDDDGIEALNAALAALAATLPTVTTEETP